LGSEYSLKDFFHLDLGEENISVQRLSSQSELSNYIKKQKKLIKKNLPFGGYGEKRNLYQSDLFKSDEQIRNIHLAIDVWVDAGIDIYAPIEGVVHSIAYNDNGLDYGNTLILKHQIGENTFFTLYGHLSSSIFDMWNISDPVISGDNLGTIGNISENGGWAPHVHCQIIFDLEGNTADYPGVCSEVEKEKYLQNCPDPSILILPK